jgi:hypothetical protein
LSTAQANLFEWKQEVNRRLAEHRSRRNSPVTGPQAVATPQRDGGHSRSAEAAARVAQRFAHAPSYIDMLVDDARTRQAEEAQCAAVATAEEPAAHAEFAAVAEDAPAWESGIPTHAAVADWSSEQPVPVRNAAEPREDSRLFGSNASELMEPPADEWTGTGMTEEMQELEADALHGNLIEFPRELVATRKIRPRLVEGPLAATRSPQLSIFEVDPGTVSTVAEVATVQAAPGWNQADWSGIKLDAQSAGESAQPAGTVAAAVAEIELAPLSRRLLALVVDAALISMAVIAAGAVFAWNASAPLGPRELGVGGAVAFVAATLLYDLLFFSLAHATPGMRYACIGLWTFGNERPTREQRWRRLAAMGLSVLPAGLERLCWHDRLSQTYLKSSF